MLLTSINVSIVIKTFVLWERSGSVAECLTYHGAAGSSLTGATVLWSLSKTHYPSLELVQPRKTRPCLTERLLMGHKESNQTKQTDKPLFCLFLSDGFTIQSRDKRF